MDALQLLKQWLAVPARNTPKELIPSVTLEEACGIKIRIDFPTMPRDLAQANCYSLTLASVATALRLSADMTEDERDWFSRFQMELFSFISRWTSSEREDISWQSDLVCEQVEEVVFDRLYSIMVENQGFIDLSEVVILGFYSERKGNG